MISRLRQWFADVLRSGSPPAARPGQGPVSATPDSRAGDADDAQVSDGGDIAARYFRSLFLATDEHAHELKPGEQAWLRAQRKALRGEEELLSAMVPRLPAAMPRLLAATRAPEKTSARELARLIEDDPVLSAKVLKVVNSPAMRLRREKVGSIEQAVVVMGFPGMRAVIAAACISPIADFRRDARLNNATVQQVWPHTLEAAVAAREAAVRNGIPNGFELYVAALCHGSGLMLLLRRLRDLDEPLPGRQFIDALDPLARRFSLVIARGWDFPEATVTALRQWADDASNDPAAELLAQAVHGVRARALAGDD